MYKTIILTLLIIAASCRLSAQTTGFLPGYVITNSSDTLKGFVKYINAIPYRVLPDIKFRETENGSNTTYTPKELRAYKAGEKTFHSIKIPARRDSTLVFMALLVDGYQRLYEYQETSFGAPGYGGGTSTVYYLIKTGEEIPFRIGYDSFRDAASEYFADDVTLSEKIKKGIYKKRHLAQIVTEYNLGRAMK